MKVSVSLENGDTEIFDGYVTFEDKLVEYSNTLAGEISLDKTYPIGNQANGYSARYLPYDQAKSCTYDTVDGVLLQRFNLLEYNAGGYQLVQLSRSSGNPIYGDAAEGALSFDFYMTDVPYATPTRSEISNSMYGGDSVPLDTDNGVRALIYLNIGEGLWNDGYLGAKSMLVFGIYNSEEGLVLYYDDGVNYGKTPIKLGVSAKTFFKLSFDWTPTEMGYDVNISVNGKVVGTVSAESDRLFYFPIRYGTGIALGYGVDEVDETPENRASTQQVWYRNINMATEIDAPLNDLLDKYGFMSDLELQAKSVGDSYSLRFLTKIQDLNYREVGFEITVKDLNTGATSQTITYKSDTAYTSVVANGETVEAGEGNYYVGAVVTGIPQSGNYSFEIRTYVVTADGTTLYGELASVQIPDAVA